ncbi:hypothetical protein V6N13_142235 [Hibiscus sabdariffa]
MANLHFTEEDFENMESLHFEKEHQVEGSDKWIVGKVLAPAAVDHDMLIQVDSGKSKLDVVHRPKPSIVLTKKGVVAAATLVPTRDEGVVIARPMQTVMTTGVALSSSKIQSSKRTYSPKDAEGLAMVSKKARASGSVANHVLEDMPPSKGTSVDGGCPIAPLRAMRILS